MDVDGGGKMWLPGVMLEDAIRHGEDSVCYCVCRYWYKHCFSECYQQRLSASGHAHAPSGDAHVGGSRPAVAAAGV